MNVRTNSNAACAQHSIFMRLPKFRTCMIWSQNCAVGNQQAEGVQNDENEMLANMAEQRKCKRLKHGGGHAYDRSIDLTCRCMY